MVLFSSVDFAKDADPNDYRSLCKALGATSHKLDFIVGHSFTYIPRAELQKRAGYLLDLAEAHRLDRSDLPLLRLVLENVSRLPKSREQKHLRLVISIAISYVLDDFPEEPST